ncbi:hypothetical protein JOJ87_002662 [Rhodococcus ruber]|nr:hypothetical protein [Rhodococcus ruber]
MLGFDAAAVVVAVPVAGAPVAAGACTPRVARVRAAALSSVSRSHRGQPR